MRRSRKGLLTYVLAGVVATVLSVNLAFKGEEVKLLETSVLSILQKVVEKHALTPPDLAIEKVTLKKSGNPTADFNYYKFKTTIILHNYGGKLRNEQVAIRAFPEQKNVIIKNTEEGFTLLENDTYIVRNYEVLMDGDYNGGEFSFEVDLLSEEDYFEDNNTFKVAVFEGPAKIGDIGVKDLKSDGSLELDFDAKKFMLRKHEFNFETADSLLFSGKKVEYNERSSGEKIFRYYVMKNDLKDIKGNFVVKEISQIDTPLIKFSDDPSSDSSEHFVYVKAVNPENGFYAVSDVLQFSYAEEMTRAEFAKIFIDTLEIPLDPEGTNNFYDLQKSDWYIPYVQTLYNLGLLTTNSTNFGPGEKITRGEVLRVVLDYLDVDLQIAGGGKHFSDVDEKHVFYPYVEAVFASGKAKAIKDTFNLSAPATRDFLNYLIYEYSENN